MIAEAVAQAFRRRAIAVEVERRRRAVQPSTERTFLEWLPRISPHLNWHWRHIRLIAERLQRVEDGTCKRLIINAPVRHGKSVVGSVHFPARYLRRFPEHNVIIGSYGQTLAEKFSRRARSLARHDGVPLNSERQAADDWETAAGGGLRAVGVGAGITGQGGHLIIVDDPHKSRREAESITEREKVWDWWTNDLYTRLEPDGAIILTMARWHKDDLTGRLLEQEGGDEWEVLHLPALAEEDDPLGREIGEALCPERFSAATLQRIREAIGEYAFMSLYQGNPIARSGGMFEPYDWPVLEAWPVCDYYVRYWDTAGTKKKENRKAHDPDYTVGALLGMREGRRPIVLDVVRFRAKVAERDAIIERTARADHERLTGNVVQWLEKEAGVAGEDRTKAIVARLAGLRVSTEPPTGDKVLRAEPFASQGQAGNVALSKGEWNDPFCAELADFPAGKHDDQVDAAGAAFNKLAEMAAQEWGTFEFSV